MSDKINKNEEGLAAMVKEHDTALNNEDAAFQDIYKAHGSQAAHDPKIFQQKLGEWKQAKTEAFHQELANIQTRFRGGAAELEAKISRNRVSATNGEKIITRYAEQMNIDREAARAELNEYASRKASRFNPESLADQYAALKHLPNLKDLDRQFAEKTLESELAAAVPQDDLDDLKWYQYHANMSPLILADTFRGHDWALAAYMRGKFKQ